MYILSVIPLTKIPFPAPQTLDYFSKDEILPGAVVEITIGSRNILAIALACIGVLQKRQQIKRFPFTLKPIKKVINGNGVVIKPYLDLAVWTSSYFYSPLGLVMKTLLPRAFGKPTDKFLKELMRVHYDTAQPAGSGAGPAKSDMKSDRGAGSDNDEIRKPILFLARHNEKARFNFYTREIQKTFRQKKSVLFLVPEIYKIQYFQDRMPILKSATVVQSGHTARQQDEIWQKVRNGTIQCVIGTRSSLAIHFPNLGLVIIDEEESPLYKSFDQQPYINAKDIALKLGELARAHVILGTNLPSSESFWKAKQGEYELRETQSTKQEAEIKIIDMKEELKAGNYSIFSRELQAQLQKTLGEGKQVILCINRRGFSSGLLCRDCGHIVKCPNCDVPMVFHATGYGLSATSQKKPAETPGLSRGYRLICHHCGHTETPPTVCPKCESYRIKHIGAGTQRVEQELKKFCDTRSIGRCRIAVLDTDATPSWKSQEDIFNKFRDKKYDVVIGTQLMLKEGLLPKGELACLITLDPLLSLPDFRTNELAFRIVDKVKASSATLLILQTYIMDNHFIRAIQGNIYATKSSPPNASTVPNIFFEEELQARRDLSYPPFSQLIRLTTSHQNPEKAGQEAQILKKKLETQAVSLRLPTANYQLLGASPSFIPRIKDRFIWQIVIKSKIENLALRNKLLRVAPSDWKIDVDPVEMV